MEGSSSRSEGSVTCGTWIRRPENAHLAVVGKARHGDQPSMLEIFSFDPKTSSLFPFPSVSFSLHKLVRVLCKFVTNNYVFVSCLFFLYDRLCTWSKKASPWASRCTPVVTTSFALPRLVPASASLSLSLKFTRTSLPYRLIRKPA